MDEEQRQLESELRLQYEEIIKQEHNTPERAKSINRFLILCQRLPDISRPNNLIYADALNRTWIRLFKKIEKGEFNPNPDDFLLSLLSWIRTELKYRLIDTWKENNPGWVNLDNPVRDENAFLTYLNLLPDNKLSGLEQLLELEQQQRQKCLASLVKRYLKEDSAGKLKNCILSKYPQCNCQILSQKRLFKEPPETWSNIASELKIPVGSLTSFWWRKCQPLLQSIAQEIAQSYKN